MRFLKNKLAKARQQFCEHEDRAANDKEDIKTPIKGLEIDQSCDILKEKPIKEEEKSSNSSKKKSKKEPNPDKKSSSSSQSGSSKNIVKNFGRAIFAFVLSDISSPYLDPLIRKQGVKLDEFRNFISTGKESIDGISSFRRLLLIDEEEKLEIQAYKTILKEMSVIFIKFFSVNWIFSSKLRNKIAHLKCRFKMLRRVMDPEHFTYLKTSN